jgi:hypothetical protein
LETIEDNHKRLQAAEEWLALDPKSEYAKSALIYVLKSQIPQLEESLFLEKTEKEQQRQKFENLRQQDEHRNWARQQENEKKHRQLLNQHRVAVVTMLVITLIVALVATFTTIQDFALQHQYTVVKMQYTQLETIYASLDKKYQELSDVAITPPYISIQGRDMKIAFIGLDKKINYWEVPFDTLEYELYRGNYVREFAANSSAMLSLHDEAGNNYSVEDMSLFVDSSSFEQVIPNLYQRSGSDDAFIREVWNIVTQLDTYSAEIGEKPRFPLETFLAGGGDCDDTAVLLASMLLAAPVKWKIQLVYMDIDHPTNPQTVNHVIVFVDTGIRKYFIETTTHEIMEPYTNGVTGWYYDAGQ